MENTGPYEPRFGQPRLHHRLFQTSLHLSHFIPALFAYLDLLYNSF